MVERIALGIRERHRATRPGGTIQDQLAGGERLAHRQHRLTGAHDPHGPPSWTLWPSCNGISLTVPVVLDPRPYSHLHRLEDDHGVLVRDLIAVLNPDLPDGAGVCASTSAIGGRRISGRAGPMTNLLVIVAARNEADRIERPSTRSRPLSRAPSLRVADDASDDGNRPRSPTAPRSGAGRPHGKGAIMIAAAEAASRPRRARPSLAPVCDGDSAARRPRCPVGRDGRSWGCRPRGRCLPAPRRRRFRRRPAGQALGDPQSLRVRGDGADPASGRCGPRFCARAPVRRGLTGWRSG